MVESNSKLKKLGNKDAPANPTILNIRNTGNGRHQKDFIDVRLPGLTKLEYAAIQAMSGLLANPNISHDDLALARSAMGISKILFDELEKQNES